MKMTSKILMAAMLSASFTGVAMAQTTAPTTDPGHPRVNEVDQRLANQQNRTNAGVANGTITNKQAMRDEKRDDRVQNEATRDEAKNGGTLTKGEQAHMNNQLNRNSADIKAQKAN